MNITSAQYINHQKPDGTSETSSIKVIIDDKTIFVPVNSENIDYQALLEWAEEDGNEIQAAE